MLIGYMRPYQDDLNCEQQTEMLQKLSCDKYIIEEHFSAKRRIKLDEMMNGLEKNDKIAVAKLFTFADSTRHLVELLTMLEEKEAFLVSLAEDIDTSCSNGMQFSTTVKHLVAFQSDVISEKTREGLQEAKQKGVVAGRPRKPDENVKRAIAMYQSKRYSLTEIKNETGISKATLYRYMES